MDTTLEVLCNSFISVMEVHSAAKCIMRSAAGILVHHLRLVHMVFSSCLLHSHPLSGLWSVRLPSLFRSSYSLSLGSAVIANILSSSPDLVLISTVIVDILAEHCTDCSASKLFCCAATTFFLISSMRPVASFSSSFLVRKAFQLVPQLIHVPSLSLFMCNCLFKHIVQVTFSFCTFSATLRPRNFLSFHPYVEHLVVRRDLCPFSFGFRMFQSVYGALSSAASRGLLPPGFR